MKTLLTGFLLLSSLSSFAKDYPCSPYLKSHADSLYSKSDKSREAGFIAGIVTLGIGAPVTVAAGLLFESHYNKKGDFVVDVRESFNEADATQEEHMEGIIKENKYNVQFDRDQRLRNINSKRLKKVQSLMTKSEFDELHPFNSDIRFQEVFNSLSINQFLKKLNKVSKEEVSFEQLRHFIIAERETDYFCGSKEDLKFTNKRLKEIAKDVLKY